MILLGQMWKRKITVDHELKIGIIVKFSKLTVAGGSERVDCVELEDLQGHYYDIVTRKEFGDLYELIGHPVCIDVPGLEISGRRYAITKDGLKRI